MNPDKHSSPEICVSEWKTLLSLLVNLSINSLYFSTPNEHCIEKATAMELTLTGRMSLGRNSCLGMVIDWSFILLYLYPTSASALTPFRLCRHSFLVNQAIIRRMDDSRTLLKGRSMLIVTCEGISANLSHPYIVLLLLIVLAHTRIVYKRHYDINIK